MYRCLHSFESYRPARARMLYGSMYVYANPMLVLLFDLELTPYRNIRKKLVKMRSNLAERLRLRT